MALHRAARELWYKQAASCFFFPQRTCPCLHTRPGTGLRASLLLIRCPSLVVRPLSLSVPLSVPCGPLCFPSVSCIPPSLSSFQSVRHNYKGFVLESCSLVLSSTYRLTALALFHSVSLCHLH